MIVHGVCLTCAWTDKRGGEGEIRLLEVSMALGVSVEGCQAVA